MAAFHFTMQILGWEFAWGLSNESAEETQATEPVSLSLHSAFSDGNTPAFGFTPTPLYWEEEE